MTRQYAAFISYRHRPLDIAVATRIHKRLERFKIPRDLRREERNNPGTVFTNWPGDPPERLLVFRDREELPLSNDLTADIFDALDNAKCLIVVCTPDTPKSLWVRREINHFIEKHGRKRIITVLAAGTPEESIPKEITTRYAEDGVTVLEEYEPLVAYLVADSQKKVMRNLDKELLRICVALLGCPYDSLRQRHRRRKMRQLAAAYGAALLVALSFIGLLLNRNLEIRAQKQEVEAQKMEVEAQKQKVEEQKLEAEAQRRMVQLRESELLAANAKEALAAGNLVEALRNAVGALPKEGEEDRPYYAPAESILMEAMDVMGGVEDHVLLSDTVLEQMTPIDNLTLSEDGTVAVTVDTYGVIHCYDTVTGQKKWTDIVSRDDTEIVTSTGYLQTTADGSGVIYRCDELLQCRDLQTGQLIWSQEIPYSADGYFIYDKVQNRIAVLRNSYDSQYAHLLELMLISAATGETQQTISLEPSELSMYETIHDTYNKRLPTGGTFSDDGRYFACAMPRDHEDSAKEWLDCFVIDLQEETVVTFYTEEIPYRDFEIARMAFCDDGLIVALQVDEDTVAGSVLKLDWKNNVLAWHTTTPAELNNYFYSSDLSAYVLFTNEVVILGRFEKLYALDQKTGQILHAHQLPGTLTSLYPVGDHDFGFSLMDGTYAIGWYSTTSGFTLTTEEMLYVTVSVGEHSYLRPQGGGVIQLNMDGQYLSISISNVVQPGYLAFVPAENENQLIIRRPVTIEKTVEPSFLALPLETNRLYCSAATAVTCQDGSLLLGKFRYYGDDGTHYFYVELDPETKTVKQIIEVDESSGERAYFFLPDRSGFLAQTSTGVTSLIRDGQETVLADKVDPLATEKYQYRVSGMVTSDSEYLSDGTVLTACSDSQKLRVLKNGVEFDAAPLPESHRYSEELEAGVRRYLRTGRNGYVVTFLTWLLQPVSATDVAFYSVADDTWILPQLEYPLTNTEAIAFANAKPQVALVDADHTVRILDLKKNTQVTSFSLQLPSSSVMYMDFLLDDNYLMVKTKDAKVLVYEIASQQIVLQEQLETTFGGTLTACMDANAQRLYIMDSYQRGTNALCIDIDSWTVLGRAENALCYLPQTNELYQIDNSLDVTQAQLFIFQIPDTAKLVQRAQELLEAD